MITQRTIKKAHKAGLLGVIMFGMCIFGGTPSWGEPIPVGVAWESPSGMADRVLLGMQQTLPTEITLDIRKNLEGPEALREVIAEFESTKKAMVILRSSGAIVLAPRSLTIPTFIGAANNPMELGVAESLTKPKKNLSGVTYYLPARMKLETFQQIYPDLANVLLLVEEGHPSSPIDMRETEEAAPDLGLSVEVVSCKTIEEAQKAIEESPENISVILGSQALFIDGASALVQAAGKRPIFSYSEKPVEKGAFCGVVAEDVKLGTILGNMVSKVLLQGVDVNSLGIETDPDPKLLLNVSRIEALGLNIPYDLLETATLIE